MGDFIIEVDGQQHFKVAPMFMPTQEKLLLSQKNDRQKMRFIFEKGFKMIRFDYSYAKKSVEYIAAQIKHAMTLLEDEDKLIWLSKPDIYTWLSLDSNVIVTGDIPVGTLVKKKKQIKVINKVSICVDELTDEKKLNEITLTTASLVDIPITSNKSTSLPDTSIILIKKKKKAKIVVINKSRIN